MYNLFVLGYGYWGTLPKENKSSNASDNPRLVERNIMANTNIYDLSVEERDGSLTSLSSFDGKVLLIVNTATGCGFTPQYEDLERILRCL